MDKFSEKDKSSRKNRDDRGDRESTTDHRDRDRDRHHKNHRGRDHEDAEEHHRSDDHHHHRRSDRESKREGSHEDREDWGELDDRSRSRSYKRKDYGGSEDRYEGGDKKIRVADEVKKEDRRERIRLEDGMEDSKSKMEKKPNKEEKRERRKFGDKVKNERNYEAVGDAKQMLVDVINVKKEVNEGLVDAAPTNVIFNDSGSAANGAAVEPLNMASSTVPSLDPSHIHRTKVSSIYTPNENKGVSITRSHAVPGKSSTDGTSSTAGKTGNLSLDALAKAKKALQMQKELSEKMKKIPLVSRVILNFFNFLLHSPLRRFEDPENAFFMESIIKSECPKKLEPADRRIPVHVNLTRREENYTEPKKVNVTGGGIVPFGFLEPLVPIPVQAAMGVMNLVEATRPNMVAVAAENVNGSGQNY